MITVSNNLLVQNSNKFFKNKLTIIKNIAIIKKKIGLKLRPRIQLIIRWIYHKINHNNCLNIHKIIILD